MAITTLKITGIWKGELREEGMESWTVVKLREEVARRFNCIPHAVKLICSGEILNNDGGIKSLSELGLRNNSKIFASLQDPGAFLAEEERRDRVRRRRIAFGACIIAEKNSETCLPFEFYGLDVEDQSGKIKCFRSEENYRSAIAALILQTKAKRLMAEGNYVDALPVLCMAQAAFRIFHPESLRLIGNNSILQIDIVWCSFMLHDIKSLPDLKVRLDKAREGLEPRASSEDEPYCYTELALILRLEVLEAAVAYHTGQFNKSRLALASATKKFARLILPDEALSRVMSFGFTERDAKRALRIHNHDVEEAIDFLVDVTTKKEQKIREKRRYGKTPSKNSTHIKRLKELISEGFEKELAAEALRRNENDATKAKQDLENPETKSTLQVEVKSRQRKRIENWHTKMAFIDMVEHGFERSKVAAAFENGGTLQEALRLLAVQFPKGLHGGASSSTPLPNNASSSDEREAEKRDAGIEDELYEDIARTHIFKDYDHEVVMEGQVIIRYLSVLGSA